ncbi:MAG: hypothetical protein WCW31_05285 [Patescibacteria group bacterium]|jgi:hypothetical protein
MKKFKIALQAYYILLATSLILGLIQKKLIATEGVVAIIFCSTLLLTTLALLYALGLNSLNSEAGTVPANKAMGKAGWTGSSTFIILWLTLPLLKSKIAFASFACIFLFASMLAIGIGVQSTFGLKAPQPR